MSITCNGTRGEESHRAELAVLVLEVLLVHRVQIKVDTVKWYITEQGRREARIQSPIRTKVKEAPTVQSR